MATKKQTLPDGMTEKEVLKLIEDFEKQTEDEAIAEMEDAEKLIPIDNGLFQAAKKMAQEKKTTVEKLINSLLKKSILKAG